MSSSKGKKENDVSASSASAADASDPGLDDTASGDLQQEEIVASYSDSGETIAVAKVQSFEGLFLLTFRSIILVIRQISTFDKIMVLFIALLWLFIYLQSKDKEQRTPLDGAQFPPLDPNDVLVQAAPATGSTVIDPNTGLIAYDGDLIDGPCYETGMCGDEFFSIGGSNSTPVENFDNMIIYDEEDLSLVGMDLATAFNDRDQCKMLTKEEARNFLCDRKLETNTKVWDAIRGTKACKREVSLSKCQYFKVCLYNMVRTHYNGDEDGSGLRISEQGVYIALPEAGLDCSVGGTAN